MKWQYELVLIGFIFYETVVINIYKRLDPSQRLWLILGSKIVKLVLTIGGILAAKMLCEGSVKEFALVTIGIYLIATIVETIYFLKKK
ncbi:MAG: hypothetical protein KBT20_05285 [Bacteroidales bacterium]|nr:hypothetical protein [Candidatus Liminaster caballi]